MEPPPPELSSSRLLKAPSPKFEVLVLSNRCSRRPRWPLVMAPKDAESGSRTDEACASREGGLRNPAPLPPQERSLAHD